MYYELKATNNEGEVQKIFGYSLESIEEQLHKLENFKDKDRDVVYEGERMKVSEMEEILSRGEEADRFMSFAIKEGMIGAEEAREMTTKDRVEYMDRSASKEYEFFPGEKDTFDPEML